MPLKALFRFPFRFANKPDAFPIDFREHFHRGFHPLPGKAGGSGKDMLRGVEKIAAPGFLQARPITLDRIAFAVIWRVVGKAQLQACRIGELHHPVEKLRAVSAAFRPVVHVQQEAFHAWMRVPSGVPPSGQPVSYEVACPHAGGEKQEGLPFEDFKDASRDKFYGWIHVVVEGFDRFEPARFPATRVFADIHDGLGVYAYPERFRSGVGSVVQAPGVFEDGVRPSGFFLTLAFSTVRSR